MYRDIVVRVDQNITMNLVLLDLFQTNHDDALLWKWDKNTCMLAFELK